MPAQMIECGSVCKCVSESKCVQMHLDTSELQSTQASMWVCQDATMHKQVSVSVCKHASSGGFCEYVAVYSCE